MTRYSLLCFLALTSSITYAQSLKASKESLPTPLTGKRNGRKPMLLATLSPLATKQLPTTGRPIAPPGLATSLLVEPVVTASMERSGELPKTTGVRVANPALVEVISQKPYLLPIDRSAIRGSYPLGISDRKTTHIIFPASIKEFDAGTDYVLAQIPQTVTNVLRVKANPKATVFCRADSGQETNMTVITDDGGFYSFLIRFQEEPEILNINIANNVSADELTSRALGINRATVTFTSSATAGGGLGMDKSELAYQCQRVHERKPFIRNIGASKMRMSHLLTGIYVSDKVMYMRFELQNEGQLDYEVDFVKFYVRDKEVMKRMAAQEVELKPYVQYPDASALIRAKSERTRVYALPLTSLTEDRIIDVELYEKNGGRHLRFQIEPDVLLLAKPM